MDILDVKLKPIEGYTIEDALEEYGTGYCCVCADGEVHNIVKCES